MEQHDSFLFPMHNNDTASRVMQELLSSASFVDIDDSDDQLYTRTQNRFLSILPMFTCIPSLMGSGLILYILWKERSTLLKRTYHRIILSISFCDILFSIQFLFLRTWAIPEYASSFVVGARAQTNFFCNLSGFLTTFILGSCLCTMNLMIYFILTVQFRCSQDWIARRVEPWMHLSSIAITLTLAFGAVLTDQINPYIVQPGMCFLVDFPPGCTADPNVECERGGEAHNYFVYAGNAICFLVLFVVLVAMIFLVCQVYKTERKMRKYAGSLTSPTHMVWRQTQESAIRGLLYILAFTIFVVPISWNTLVEKSFTRENREFFFRVSLVVDLLSWNLGFFNAIIYLKPRFRELIAPPNGTLHWLQPLVAHVEAVPCCASFWSFLCCTKCFAMAGGCEGSHQKSDRFTERTSSILQAGLPPRGSMSGFSSQQSHTSQDDVGNSFRRHYAVEQIYSEHLDVMDNYDSNIMGETESADTQEQNGNTSAGGGTNKTVPSCDEDHNTLSENNNGIAKQEETGSTTVLKHCCDTATMNCEPLHDGDLESPVPPEWQSVSNEEEEEADGSLAVPDHSSSSAEYHPNAMDLVEMATTTPIVKGKNHKAESNKEQEEPNTNNHC